jgi:hypothetical protein
MSVPLTVHVIAIMFNHDHVAGGQIVQYVVESEVAQLQRPVLGDQTRARVESAVRDFACLVQELKTLRDMLIVSQSHTPE